MFDAAARKLIDPPLNAIGQGLSARGITANQMTIGGGVIGFLAIPALAFELYLLAAAFIILNRIADGLDGALARAQGPTDFGGYLDIVIDFLFYNGIVFGFVLANPQAHAIAGAFLLFSFVGTGITFLTFAILAAKRGISTDVRGKKSFYYMGGLTEGAETIVALLAMCIWPSYFVIIAFVYGSMCWLTTVTRLMMAREFFDDGVFTTETNISQDHQK